MNKINHKQLILTVVANRTQLPLSEITQIVEKNSYPYGLKVVGKEILEPELHSAVDFFLLKNPHHKEIKTKISNQLKNNIDRLYEDLRPYFSKSEYDFCIQSYDPLLRKKKVFFSDMDSTLIANESLDEIAQKAGVGNQVAQITKLSIEGKIDFQESVRARLSLLKGIKTCSLFEKTLDNIKINLGADVLINTLNHHQVATFLVTGGFNPIASNVQKKLGLQNLVCNNFKTQNPKFTGECEGKIVDAKKKLSVMQEHLTTQGMIFSQTMTIGDGSNDIPMLKAAGLGIAYCATDKVKNIIPHQINFTSLTTALYYQGYHNQEFITHG